ncbi:MAG TPA: hypothetical protein VKR52_04310 [Terracidiphilus sp.]|nr:hypothetical protein [Terracidiphilus sp.]
MEPRYCIYNRTTDRFLSVGTTVVDGAIEPFEVMELPPDVENITAEWGLCVVPAQSFSRGYFTFPIGVVFLDADRRVLECFEWTPGEEWPDEPGSEAVSVLVMPSQSVAASRTHPGDQFIICPAEELVRHLARIPSVKNGGSASSSTGEECEAEPLETPVREKKSRNGRRAQKPDAATPRILEASEQPNVMVDQPAKKSADSWHIGESYQRGTSNGVEIRQTDLQADEIESVVSQVLQWSRPGEVKLPAEPEAAPPAIDHSATCEEPLPVLEMQEPQDLAAEESDDAELLEDDEPAIVDTLEGAEVPGVMEREPVKSEFDRAEIESVVSQVLQWAQQTGRPVTRTADATPQMMQAPQATNGNGLAAQNGREGVQNGHRPPATGTNGKNGSQVRSRFGRWADEFARPLGNGIKSKPVVRIKIRTQATPERKNGGVERDGAQKGWRLSAALQKFKENGKGLLSAEGIHTLKSKFTKWLDEDHPNGNSVGPADRRRSSRHALPDLIAYYWTGGTPQAHRVGDISCNGFYLLTDERWVPDTVIRMTLQRTGGGGPNKDEAISVLSKVVRWGKDGVGHEFILSDSVNMRSGRHTSGKEKVKEALQEFL